MIVMTTCCSHILYGIFFMPHITEFWNSIAFHEFSQTFSSVSNIYSNCTPLDRDSTAEATSIWMIIPSFSYMRSYKFLNSERPENMIDSHTHPRHRNKWYIVGKATIWAILYNKCLWLKSPSRQHLALRVQFIKCKRVNCCNGYATLLYVYSSQLQGGWGDAYPIFYLWILLTGKSPWIFNLCSFCVLICCICVLNFCALLTVTALLYGLQARC